jgi:Domain of unknown function (DUF4166)/Saccharopine dehydrogenase NADP binding domain
MTNSLKVLVVGGNGVFGSRIVALLEDEPRLGLFVGGRSVDRATNFVLSRGKTQAQLAAVAFDGNGDVVGQLSAIGPDIVVDASGPFQAYGEDRYRVVRACLAHGANYLDLADGSDFVAGIDAHDEQAKAAGVYVLSGVSSFPVLTAAAVRRLSTGMTAIKSIRGGIAPSPYADVGENVIRAIAGYAGQPIRRKHDGVFCSGYPLTEQLRYTIAAPGHVPLHNRLFSLVDAPDLQALAVLWPEADEIWMGAAPVPESLHRFLIALAWLVRFRLLPTLSPIARLMHFATNRIRWGEHRGGMFVEVRGIDGSGAPIERAWHMLAEGDDGPFIPSMAVEAIVRNALEQRPPPPGARAAVRDLELDDYVKPFARRAIFTGMWRDKPVGAEPLYARILGEVWHALPAPIRDMHDVRGTTIAEGRARVERGRSLLARLVGAFVGFPKAGADMPVRVQFDASDGIETWSRKFGSDVFVSRQFAGDGRSAHLLCERLGALTFAMALVVADERLSLILRRWSLFDLPLPLWLGPRSVAYESAEDGRFNFHVRISLPLTGLIIRYDGWLVRKSG